MWGSLLRLGGSGDGGGLLLHRGQAQHLHGERVALQGRGGSVGAGGWGGLVTREDLAQRHGGTGEGSYVCS